MSNMLEIGARIKDEREKRNLTQEELASQAKIESYQTLGKIERGERKDLKTTELQKIAEALGVSIGYLLGEFTQTQKSLIFWRKEPATAKKTALENKLHSFIEDYSFLEEVLNQNKKILVVEGEKQDLNDTVFSDLDKYQKPKEIVFVPEFKETISGKILRKETLK